MPPCRESCDVLATPPPHQSRTTPGRRRSKPRPCPPPKPEAQVVAISESPLFLLPPEPTPASPRRRAPSTSAPASTQRGRGLASYASGLHSVARRYCAAGPRSPLLDWAAGRCGPLSYHVFFPFLNEFKLQPIVQNSYEFENKLKNCKVSSVG
jgi:hypothetical protein